VTRRPAADVAIYSPFAGPLYSSGSSGGAEVQSVMLARALAAGGLRVRHIVLPDGPVDAAREGVEVISIGAGYRRGGAARRLAALAALRRADAAVYVQRSAGFETGIVAAYARANRRRFIFSASSVADFSLDPLTIRLAGAGLESRVSRAQYRLGLKFAHAVIAQTFDQRELARSNLNVGAEVVRSFGPAFGGGDSGARTAFLWVGALAEVKDPLAYLALARAVPEGRFTMVGGHRIGAEKLAARVRDEAEELPNLSLSGSRAREDLLADYGRALAVVSTSRFEGFPNTFLEGWAHGTPALSLRFDPDGVIEQHGLGTAAGGSIDRLADAARALIAQGTDPAGRAALRAYVAQHHDPAVVGPQWVDLVRSLMR
jgi:hypothetical protein